MTEIDTHQESNCANCGSPAVSKFCANCGEKKLVPDHDFSILHFLKEILESLTHLDSKIIRSYTFLMFKPGFLTHEFMQGRRVRYLKPIPLFFISALFFYFFLPTVTSFFSNFEDMDNGFSNQNHFSNTFSVDTKSLFLKIAAQSGLPESTIKSQVVAEAAHRSKSWLFMIIPFWGMLLWLFFFRRIKWLVPT